MKRITTAVIFIALVAMPFGFAVADCGMDHGAKAKETSSRMEKMSKGDMTHAQMMKHNMSEHNAMMMSHMDKMEEHLKSMMQMTDIQKLQQALMEHQAMMNKLKEEMKKGRKMHQHAVQMAVDRGDSGSDDK